MRRGRHALGVAAALVASGLVAACGVRSEGEFRAVDAADVPFGLVTESTVRPATTTPVTTAPVMSTVAPPTSPPPATTVADTRPDHRSTLYFVRDGRLVSVSRSSASSPTAVSVVTELTNGALASDTPPGLRSVLRPEHVARVSAAGGLARVAITPDFAEKLPSGEQQLAVAQLVYTLTALPGIGQVLFERDGLAIEVPRSDGSLASGAITRDDLAGALGRESGNS